MAAYDAPLTTFQAPLYVAWEITHHCNANCIHCYSDSGPTTSRVGELNTEDALSDIDQLADAGVLILAFSGGEPLVRKDWQILAERAVSKGLGVNIGTNGSSITPAIARRVRELGIKSVTVSLDSHDPERHDRFRRLPGLFARATRAVRFLVAEKVRVVVGFTPTRINWMDGPKVIELAAELGADAVNLSEYVPAGRGGIDLALSPEELRRVLGDWIELRARLRDRIQVIWHDCRVGMLVPEGEKRDYVGCGAGRLVARILPNGTVTPCVFLPTSIGSFQQTSFRKMWNESYMLRRFRQREGHITGNCGGCEYLGVCGGCRAVAYTYSKGNAFAGDPHCWVRIDQIAPLARLPDGEGLPA